MVNSTFIYFIVIIKMIEQSDENKTFIDFYLIAFYDNSPSIFFVEPIKKKPRNENDRTVCGLIKRNIRLMTQRRQIQQRRFRPLLTTATQIHDGLISF